MTQERQMLFDSELEIELLLFNGIKQKFPNHFHDYYVIGCIEQGKRKLTCKEQVFQLDVDDMILLNPFDNHECEAVNSEPLVYRNIHIKPAILERHISSFYSMDRLPRFKTPVVVKGNQQFSLSRLHQLLMDQEADSFEKEEQFILLLSELLAQHADYSVDNSNAVPHTMADIRQYIEDCYEEQLSLAVLSDMAHMNRYTFIRTFTRYFGLTPFQYLATFRITVSKQLLESGLPPKDVAVMTGFSDQSHFTRAFKSQIGITPKSYQLIYVKP